MGDAYENKCNCGSNQSCGCSSNQSNGCGCNSAGNSCGCNGAGSYESGYEDEGLMYLVKKAKFELLKEKIKKKLEATDGKKLDEAAELLVQTMREKKKAIMQIKKKKYDMQDRLQEIFSKE